MKKDIGTGILFLLIGGVFFAYSLVYQTGTANNPGTGLYPNLASLSLLILGILKLIHSKASSDLISFKVRNAALVTGGFVAFVVATHLINMAVGIIVMVIITSFASDKITPKTSAIVAVSLILVAVAFKYILKMSLPLWTS
jgi:hypothetical protein